MKIQQIRNATLRIEYAGKTFLTDPWLMGKGQMDTFHRGQADFGGARSLKDSAFTLRSRLNSEDVARRFSLRPGYTSPCNVRPIPEHTP